MKVEIIVGVILILLCLVIDDNPKSISRFIINENTEDNRSVRRNANKVIGYIAAAAGTILVFAV